MPHFWTCAGPTGSGKTYGATTFACERIPISVKSVFVQPTNRVVQTALHRCVLLKCHSWFWIAVLPIVSDCPRGELADQKVLLHYHRDAGQEVTELYRRGHRHRRTTDRYSSAHYVPPEDHYMELALYLLMTHTECPPLFVTARSVFDAVEMYRHHCAVGAYRYDDTETIVEVYRVPSTAPHPMAHPINHSTVTGAFHAEPYAINFENAYRVAAIIRLDDETDSDIPF